MVLIAQFCTRSTASSSPLCQRVSTHAWYILISIDQKGHHHVACLIIVFNVLQTPWTGQGL
jgi:hypothetical protein